MMDADDNKEREVALKTPLLEGATNPDNNDDDEQNRNCERADVEGQANNTSQDEELDDKYEKRKQQVESRLRLVRIYIGILSACFVLFNATVFSDAAHTKWRKLRRESCKMPWFPSFTVLSTANDYETFKKKHNVTFILFYKAKLLSFHDHEFMCRKPIETWNSVGQLASDLYPGLGVGAVEISDQQVHSQEIDMDIYDRPMVVLHTEEEDLAITSRGNPEYYLNLYNQTSHGIKMPFYDLFNESLISRHIAPLKSMEDYEACATAGEPISAVLVYRRSSMIVSDNAFVTSRAVSRLLYDWNALGEDIRRHLEQLRAKAKRANTTTIPEHAQPFCLGIVEVEQSPTVASKLGITTNHSLGIFLLNRTQVMSSSFMDRLKTPSRWSIRFAMTWKRKSVTCWA